MINERLGAACSLIEILLFLFVFFAYVTSFIQLVRKVAKNAIVMR